MILNEFDIINMFFKNQNIKRDDVILGIGDDCAIVQTTPHQKIAVTTDTLIAGVHFPLDTSAYDIGFKSLAVNLSDLAAMGASPSWASLALTLPDANETWLKEFSRGFFELASQHHIQLIGGDLTRGPLSITITAQGFITHLITRSHAKPDDLIYVTHTLGDAALGLLCIEEKIFLVDEFKKKSIEQLNRPQPQILLGKKLAPIAHAMIDISDGLAADLKHILNASQTGALLYIDQIPLSPALKALPFDQAISLALNGGDDYQLCFTIPPEKQVELKNLPQLTCIGKITSSPELKLQFKDGKTYHTPIHGYQHFVR